MKKYIFAIVLLIIVLLNLGCKKAPTEPNTTAALSVEDISCTEAWVKITSANIQIPNTLTLFVNDKADQNITLVSSDTLLYVDSLLPNRSYKIKATFAANNRQQTTNEVIAKTMDTTSHNFTWQTFTFGEVGSSTLYDVAIIDENNIWAVGEIYTKDSYTYDSLGKWIDPYNAVHWNGSDWELIKIYYNYRGTPSWSPIRTIFAFANNDIWYSSGLHWNGKIFEQPDNGAFDGWEPNKMWGTSSSDLYAVGNNGNIARYDGKNWQKIESGTTLNIGDIWGMSDGKGGYDKYLAADNFMIKLDSKNQRTSFTIQQSGFINSLWAKTDHLIYTAGDGVTLFKNSNWERTDNLELNLIFRIRGEDYNNVSGLSANRKIYHFNGYTWLGIATEPNNTFIKVEITKKIIASVGWQGDKALITILKK